MSLTWLSFKKEIGTNDYFLKFLDKDDATKELQDEFLSANDNALKREVLIERLMVVNEECSISSSNVISSTDLCGALPNFVGARFRWVSKCRNFDGSLIAP